MIVALLAVLLQVPPPTPGGADCTDLYTVRVTYEMTHDEWQTLEVGGFVLDRDEAMARRLMIEREGFTFPLIVPESQSEQHVTAAAIRRASVKHACCHYGPQIPIPEWWCRYDGPPPPEY